MKPFVELLVREGDPSTRYKLSAATRREIKRSERVAQLLSERERDGRIAKHPYTKWTGAHWVLATLADLGYPPGDKSLVPLRDQVLEWLLDERRLERRRASYEAYLAPILRNDSSTCSGRTADGIAIARRLRGARRSRRRSSRCAG